MADTARKLIQRLTEKLDLLHCQYNVPNQSALIDEAHAYLDQPEPEGPLGSPMTDQHPITPPPELVRHWSRFQGDTHPEALWFRIANEAAQWGADQELEATLVEVSFLNSKALADRVRAARRLKPSNSAVQTDSVAELEDRIKTLEHKLNTLRGDHLRMANAVANQLLPSDRTKFFVDFMKDAEQ